MDSMRAAVIAEPRRIIVDQVPVPSPGPGQVLVRLEGCGICASNLPVWQGRPWFEYPQTPGATGHEGWGTIAGLGRGVQGLEAGQRVTMLSSRAYAEYDVADASSVVALPQSLDDQPFPGEALGCAMNILRRSDIGEGHIVAIVGIGFLGALLTRLVTVLGAQVIAISRRPFALLVAKVLGAAETIPLNGQLSAVQRVQALTAERGCDRVIEAVGSQTALDLATQLTCERGKLIVAGYHQDGARQVDMQLWNWRGLDVINAHERDPRTCVEGIIAAVDLVDNAVIDPSALYTHPVELEQLSDAFELIETRPEGFLKAYTVV